jgi:hypothetical protein
MSSLSGGSIATHGEEREPRLQLRAAVSFPVCFPCLGSIRGCPIRAGGAGATHGGASEPRPRLHAAASFPACFPCLSFIRGRPIGARGSWNYSRWGERASMSTSSSASSSSSSSASSSASISLWFFCCLRPLSAYRSVVALRWQWLWASLTVRDSSFDIPILLTALF